MPFNVGPFEIILLVVVVAGIGLLVLQGKVKSPPAPTPRPADAPGDAVPAESLDALIAAGWRIESETTDYAGFRTVRLRSGNCYGGRGEAGRNSLAQAMAAAVPSVGWLEERGAGRRRIHTNETFPVQRKLQGARYPAPDAPDPGAGGDLDSVRRPPVTNR